DSEFDAHTAHGDDSESDAHTAYGDDTHTAHGDDHTAHVEDSVSDYSCPFNIIIGTENQYYNVTIVIDKDTEESVIKDVQRLSSAVLLHYDTTLNVIRDDDSIWEDSKQKPFTDTYVSPTVQGKDTTLTTEVPGGTTEKDEDQVMLLQEKVESIQKQLEEEKELIEGEKQFPEQVIKEYEERIATLTEQQEEVTGDLKHKTEQYEELISDNELTHNQLEELQKKLKEEKIEKEELQIKIDDLQQELEQVSVQSEYIISQSELQSEIQKIKNESETFQKQRKALILENERLMSLIKDHNVPVEQKEEAEILQETETVHTCTYISKVKAQFPVLYGKYSMRGVVEKAIQHKAKPSA
ncbi:PREDICTED: cingulin-like protein 1, partial [Amphimedon queenslandica]|uniref:Uncharacterized protein n=2 Tax=Amphimedon queenslandica TaxID=400682 RepID=A0AAN0K0Y1_AMPQE